MTTKLKNFQNFKDFDWDLTKLFYLVARFGGYTEAAKILGVGQPTLTRQIQLLEKQLGFPLLIRHMRQQRGVSPTRKGQELLSIIENVFMDMKAFARNLHDDEDSGTKERKIIVATTHALASYVIGNLLFDYNSRHPHLAFEVIEKDQAIDIILNDLDIAVRPHDPDAQNVQQDFLFALKKKLYASPDYLEKYGTPKTRNDLSKHYLIRQNFSPSDAKEVWVLKTGLGEGKAHKGKRHKAGLMFSSLELAITAAKKGKGIIEVYEELSIIKESNLINVLPHVTEETKYYFVYPDYLKEDGEIMNLKYYLQQITTS